MAATRGSRRLTIATCHPPNEVFSDRVGMRATQGRWQAEGASLVSALTHLLPHSGAVHHRDTRAGLPPVLGWQIANVPFGPPKRCMVESRVRFRHVVYLVAMVCGVAGRGLTMTRCVLRWLPPGRSRVWFSRLWRSTATCSVGVHDRSAGQVHDRTGHGAGAV